MHIFPTIPLHPPSHFFLSLFPSLSPPLPLLFTSFPDLLPLPFLLFILSPSPPSLLLPSSFPPPSLLLPSSLPPPSLLPPQLLIAAIRRNYQEKDYFQFASQLLIMTLTFLTRTIKNQALREQSPDSQHSTLALETDEPGQRTLPRLTTQYTSTGDRRTRSGTHYVLTKLTPKCTVL